MACDSEVAGDEVTGSAAGGGLWPGGDPFFPFPCADAGEPMTRRAIAKPAQHPIDLLVKMGTSQCFSFSFFKSPRVCVLARCTSFSTFTPGFSA